MGSSTSQPQALSAAVSPARPAKTSKNLLACMGGGDCGMLDCWARADGDGLDKGMISFEEAFEREAGLSLRFNGTAAVSITLLSFKGTLNAKPG